MADDQKVAVNAIPLPKAMVEDDLRAEGITARDELLMDLLGWRQIIRDAPEHAVPEIQRLIEQTGTHLKYLAQKERS